MYKLRSIGLLIFLAAALAPVSAYAQVPEITFITITPSPAVPGETVSITVDVVGGSCTFELDFGDGTSTVSDPAQGPITHVYNQTAVLRATQAPIFPCGGFASATLPILPASQLSGIGGALYCAIFGCHPTISQMPLNNVTPGGQVIFTGSGFGRRPGTAWIALQTFTGQNTQWFQLQIESGSWQPSLVVADIPSGLSNFMPQTASFQIVTQSQSASNATLLPFRPALDFADVDANRISCSMTANSPSDMCQSNGRSNFPVECGATLPGFGYTPPSLGFGGYHASGWQVFAGNNDTGTDTFSLFSPLVNGWTTAGYDFSAGSLSGAGTFAELLNPPTLASTSDPPSWSVLWNVEACNLVEYGGDIYAQGPRGVPPF
jgi:hypothetical protein